MLELGAEFQSVLVGLIGWAATAVLALGSHRLTAAEQRALIVCSWVVWMIPALGAFVLSGALTINTAALYIGVTTALLAVLMLIGSLSRTRTR